MAQYGKGKGKSKGKGKNGSQLPPWDCSICGILANWGDRLQCRGCNNIAPGTVVDRNRTHILQGKPQSKPAAQRVSAWAAGPPQFWPKPAEAAKAAGKGKGGSKPPVPSARNVATTAGSFREEPCESEVLRGQLIAARQKYGDEDVLVRELEKKVEAAMATEKTAEPPAPSERTVARRQSRAMDKAAKKVDALQQKLRDTRAVLERAKQEERDFLAELAIAQEELRVAKEAAASSADAAAKKGQPGVDEAFKQLNSLLDMFRKTGAAHGDMVPLAAVEQAMGYVRDITLAAQRSSKPSARVTALTDSEADEEGEGEYDSDCELCDEVPGEPVVEGATLEHGGCVADPYTHGEQDVQDGDAYSSAVEEAAGWQQVVAHRSSKKRAQDLLALTMDHPTGHTSGNANGVPSPSAPAELIRARPERSRSPSRG